MDPRVEKIFAEKKKEEEEREREELNNAPKTENKIASVLTIIGWLMYIAGFTLGIAFGQSSVYGGGFNASIAFIWWGSALISGTMFLGFAEVIKLLQEIRDK